MAHPSSRQPHRICVIRHGSFSRSPGFRREVEALLQEGLDVTVLCARDPGKAPPHPASGAKIYRLPPAGGGPVTPRGGTGDAATSLPGARSGFWRELFAAKWFAVIAGARLLLEHTRVRFDFVQVDNPPDFLIFVAWFTRLSGTRIVFRMAEPVPEYWLDRMPAWYQRPLITVLRLTRRLSLHIAHEVIVGNREMREALSSFGGDVNHISVVFDAADADAVRPDEYRTVIDEVGRLRREERRRGVFRIVTRTAGDRDAGGPTVIEALATLQDRLPGAECVVLDSAYASSDLLDFAHKLGVAGRVLCPPDLDAGAVTRHILAADACIVSRGRTAYNRLVTPMEIYNYVALGKAVIASRLDSTVSYFPEDSLWYFRPGDAEDLAAKIYTVFAHPEAVPQRVANASDIYDAHRWERERKKYVAVFRASG